MKRILMALTFLGIVCNVYAKPDPLQRGKAIYATSCSVCHSNGVAGVPKTHDQKAWGAKLNEAIAIVQKKTPNLDPKQQKQ